MSGSGKISLLLLHCLNLSTDGGGVVRDCLRLYTGGEALRVCYANQAQGVTCLCSDELCNHATPALKETSATFKKLLIVTQIVLSISTVRLTNG